MESKSRIVESASDKLQPFRVWFKGNIIWFAKTRKEAEEHLAQATRFNNK